MEAFDVNFLDLQQNIEPWSPMEAPREAYPSVATSFMTGQSQNLWTDDDSLRGLLRPDSSIADTNSIASFPWTENRSSGLSRGSIRTWDTASTLYSIGEYQPDDLISSVSSQQTQQIDPFTIDHSYPISRFSTGETFQNDGRCYPDTQTQTIKPLPKGGHSRSKSSSQSRLPPDVPPKAEKTPGKYACTACHLVFTKKGDWQRHESAVRISRFLILNLPRLGRMLVYSYFCFTFQNTNHVYGFL